MLKSRWLHVRKEKEKRKEREKEWTVYNLKVSSHVVNGPCWTLVGSSDACVFPTNDPQMAALRIHQDLNIKNGGRGRHVGIESLFKTQEVKPILKRIKLLRL